MRVEVEEKPVKPVTVWHTCSWCDSKHCYLLVYGYGVVSITPNPRGRPPMTDLDHEANEAARHGNREALEAMTARCEWQPIETAPKDGTVILLWAWGEPHIAYFSNDNPDWFDFHSKDFLGGPEPDGWMPLPSPPALSDKEGA